MHQSQKEVALLNSLSSFPSSTIDEQRLFLALQGWPEGKTSKDPEQDGMKWTHKSPARP